MRWSWSRRQPFADGAVLIATGQNVAIKTTKIAIFFRDDFTSHIFLRPCDQTTHSCSSSNKARTNFIFARVYITVTTNYNA